MNKLTRKTAKYSLIFLVLLAVALLVAPFFIDANHYKGLILEKVEQATGRKVDMGNLHASFFPWIGMRIDDVHMANRQGFPGEDFLQVKSLDVRLALLPLLSGKYEIGRFVLDSPKVFLERDASGSGNWEDLFSTAGKSAPAGAGNGAKTSATPEGGAPLIALSAKSLRMLNGEVHYRDVRSGSDITVTELGVEVGGVQLDQPVRAHVSGKLSGDAFSVKAEIGPMGDLSTFNIDRLPVQADIEAKSIALEKIAGFVPAMAKLGKGTLGIDARVEQRPDGLRVTAGTLSLHGTHAAEVAWNIEMPKQDRLKINHVVLRAEGEKTAEMTGSVHGIGHRLQYEVRVKTPWLKREQLSSLWPNLQTLYAAHPTPWKQVKLGLLAAGDVNHAELRDLQLMMDEDLVQASGNVRFGAEPFVRLRVASKNLHVDPWLPQPEKIEARNRIIHGNQRVQLIPDAHADDARIGQQQSESRKAATAGARIDQSQPDKIPANTEIAKEPDLRFLKPWHVIAGVQVDHLFVHGLDLSLLHAAIDGKRGVFNLDPFQFELAGGQVSEKASLNVGRYPARWRESAKVRGVQVQPVLKALAGTDMLAGIMQMDTKLSGVGLLPKAATRRLNGTGNVLLRDGMIKGFDIAGTLRNVTTLGQQSGPKQTDFSQLSGSFKIKNGVASNDDLFMASPLFRLTGYGQINLVSRNMDYHVKPRLVGSLAGQGDTAAARKGLEIPLGITGPLDAPMVKVEMDIKTLMGNVGGIKELIKKGKGGGWKQILKGALQKGSGSGNATSPAAPGTSPAPSQAPAKPAEQILRKLNIPRF